MYSNLFCDEYREVSVFLVDLCTECHEPQQVDTQSQTPHDQLPVTKVIQKPSAVMEKLEYIEKFHYHC